MLPVTLMLFLTDKVLGVARRLLLVQSLHTFATTTHSPPSLHPSSYCYVYLHCTRSFPRQLCNSFALFIAYAAASQQLALRQVHGMLRCRHRGNFLRSAPNRASSTALESLEPRQSFHRAARSLLFTLHARAAPPLQKLRFCLPDNEMRIPA
jgi:hypothetical protein